MCTFRALEGDDAHALGAGLGHFLAEAARLAALLEEDDVGAGHGTVFEEAELVVRRPLLVGQRDAALTVQDAVDDTDALRLQSF